MSGLADTVAGWFGYSRQPVRMAGYAAAEISRLTASLQSEAQFINTTLRYQGRILRARSRQAAQNNPFARRFVQMVVDNVCGPCPFELEGKVKNSRGKLDKDANERIEEAWEAWGRAGQCEITEKWSLSTVQRLLVRIWAVDGEMLVRKLRGPEFGAYGYRLQIIDVDRLYELKNQALPNGGAIHSGVEVDPTGKAVAYHILKRKPSQWQFSGLATAAYDRIPADEIQHVFAPEFAEQIRGVPMMYAALLNLVHIGAFEEAAVIAARVGAAQMGFIQSPDGTPPPGDGAKDNQGNSQISAEPGSFPTLPPGYSMAAWNPKYPDAAIEPFLKACLRGVAAGLGVAYHNLANDLENVNYSSARIGELDERDTWRGMQEFWCEHFNQPIYEDWLRMQVLMGTLPFDPARMEKYRAVYWQARRWAWVDPLKEVGAAIEGINARITSRTRVAAENGLDLEDVADEIAAEEAMFKDKGVELASIEPKSTGVIPSDQAGTEDGTAAGATAGKKKHTARWRDPAKGAD